MPFPFASKNDFLITIEVVPPAGHDSRDLLHKIRKVADLPFHAFSVASNPVARPRMSAMVFSRLVREATGKPAILHLTVRDHNRLGLLSELAGARALGIEAVICVTGDPSGKKSLEPASFVADVNVFQLMSMAGEAGFCTGGVLDYRPEVNGLDREIQRLEKKAEAGCRFIVTQPVYDEKTARKIREGTAHLDIPVLMGILPLLSPRHARFLHEKVSGIVVPENLREEMERAEDPLAHGVAQAREMLELSRALFSGACIMPPFDRFEILNQILNS
ncbi:methylenetetrahydrofolate reductase [Desulfospira joergensenii]|uniref:methylenetetrahydrofolate reductase n=1 Tax=Desulfospira joergensenii TaxID=53329 RepID=UPI0003B71237|nr:methylenetetrahydrofolate reductase [Desulfospira joergensenii]